MATESRGTPPQRLQSLPPLASPPESSLRRPRGSLTAACPGLALGRACGAATLSVLPAGCSCLWALDTVFCLLVKRATGAISAVKPSAKHQINLYLFAQPRGRDRPERRYHRGEGLRGLLRKPKGSSLGARPRAEGPPLLPVPPGCPGPCGCGRRLGAGSSEHGRPAPSHSGSFAWPLPSSPGLASTC